MSREGERRQGRRRATAVALAVLSHAVALAMLTWTTPELRLPSVDWPPDVTLELSSRAPRSTAETTPAHFPSAQPAASAPQRRRSVPPVPIRPSQPPAPTQIAPAPTAPPAAAPRPAASQTAQGGPAGASPSTPSPGAAAQDRNGGDPRGAVRAAIGCSHEDFLRLTLAEREACQRRLADQPRVAGPRVDAIDPLKRAVYDRQAAADERRRNREGPMSAPVIACSGGGSNFGTGCLPPEAMHSVRGGRTPKPPAPDVVQPQTPAP